MQEPRRTLTEGSLQVRLCQVTNRRSHCQTWLLLPARCATEHCRGRSRAAPTGELRSVGMHEASAIGRDKFDEN